MKEVGLHRSRRGLATVDESNACEGGPKQQERKEAIVGAMHELKIQGPKVRKENMTTQAVRRKGHGGLR